MKNWLIRLLGGTPNSYIKGHPIPVDSFNGSSTMLCGIQTRRIFEILPASNGKILVLNQTTYNPNGPDKNDTVAYLVPEGASLIDTIAVALVAAKLEQ